MTKIAASSDVCDGASVTYTYEVTNDSDTFPWTGDLVDDVLGTVADDVTIGPGETETYTLPGVIDGAGHQHGHRDGHLRRSRRHGRLGLQ